MDLVLSIISTLVRRRGRVLAASTLISVLCLPLAILLYANLKASVEELLPRSAPSIQALDHLHRRLGDNLQLALLVSGASSDELHTFADKFAENAQRIPSGAPRFIDYRPVEIQTFFDTRKALFLELNDLQEIEKRVQTRIDWEVNRDSDKSLGLEDDSAEAPEVKFDDISKRYEGKSGQIVTYSSGYYDSPDGRSLVMVFYPAKGVTGYGTGVAFRDELRDAAKTTASALGLHLTFQFTGISNLSFKSSARWRPTWSIRRSSS
jgi:hypothetical protein